MPTGRTSPRRPHHRQRRVDTKAPFQFSTCRVHSRCWGKWVASPHCIDAAPLIRLRETACPATTLALTPAQATHPSANPPTNPRSKPTSTHPGKNGKPSGTKKSRRRPWWNPPLISAHIFHLREETSMSEAEVGGRDPARRSE